jgi:hypothetical protein
MSLLKASAKESSMYAITGKSAIWADLGSDVAVADMSGAIAPTRHPGIFKGECNEQSSQ